MNRRQAIKIVTLSALGPCGAPGGALGRVSAWRPDDYRLRFFTDDENRLLDELMELVIPADGHSPGAHAAQVSLFADLMVSTSSREEQERWRRGLRAMRAAVHQSSQTVALARAASGEAAPHTESEHFFVILKRMTVDGYYTSEIGIRRDLNYQGNDYLSDFKGCRHPEHG
jgi:glucoside 3-dehydrogenase (cytochrome c) hitch-hiker subunit